MVSAADLWSDDEAPPPSGVRRRSPAIDVAAAEPPSPAASAATPDVMAEVVTELCADAWVLVSTLAPLQGAWLTVGLTDVGAAALTLARARHEASPPMSRVAWLRRHWPELVPGSRAMDQLVSLLVDAVCA